MILFNRSPRLSKPTGMFVTDRDVAQCLGMWGASLQTAAAFNAPLVKEALSLCPLTHSRKHTLVDIKVHMLKAGFCPAIPGWHTDGIPRQEDGSARGPLEPDYARQGSPLRQTPIYHLFVTGFNCLTEFIDEPLCLDLPPGRDLYARMTKQVDLRVASGELKPKKVESCAWTTFDWWDIHRGVPATGDEWRLLIRVTETDYDTPNHNLNDVLRTQQNVYIPGEYGW